MPKTAARVVLLCVLLANLVGAATLQKYLLSATKPPTCSDALASPPVAVNSFLTTDPQFYLWFHITDLKTGDTVESMYYDPSGTFYADASGPWDPMDHDSEEHLLHGPGIQDRGRHAGRQARQVDRAGPPEQRPDLQH